MKRNKKQSKARSNRNALTADHDTLARAERGDEVHRDEHEGAEHGEHLELGRAGDGHEARHVDVPAVGWAVDWARHAPGTFGRSGGEGGGERRGKGGQDGVGAEEKRACGRQRTGAERGGTRART